MTNDDHPGETSLADKLAQNFERIARDLPQSAIAYDKLIKRLVASGSGSGAVQCGDEFPDFLLPDQDGRLVRFAELHNGGPVVISFNRGHWCTFCRIELAALQTISSYVSSQGGGFVAIMPDRQEYTRGLHDEFQLTFPILSDTDNGFALSLGLAVHLGEEVREATLKIGLDVELYQGNKGWIVPIPATYVVDSAGMVLARYVDPDFRKRMTCEHILGVIAQNNRRHHPEV